MKAVLLNRILVVLAFVGLFVAGVLSLEAKMNLLIPCGSSGGCLVVANSPFSKVFGVPVAYFGLLGYLVLAALAVYRPALAIPKWRWSVNFGYLLAAVGSAASLYLQYLSFFVIHATCVWCLTSAVLMLATLVVYAILATEVDNVDSATPYVPDDGTPEATPDVAAPGAAAVAPRAEIRLPAILGLLVVLGVGVMGASLKHGAEVGVKPAPKVDAKELVPPGAHILGKADAPLTIVEFADLCCPTCQKVSPQVKEFVLDHPGKIRLVYRHYPLVQLHPQAVTAAVIAECAADDNRFWDYVAAVMALQRQPQSAEELLQIATQVGLNASKIRARVSNVDDPAYARLDRDQQAVHALGVNSTPTFFTMWNGKAQESIGANQIVDELKTEKYMKIMNGQFPPATGGSS